MTFDRFRKTPNHPTPADEKKQHARRERLMVAFTAAIALFALVQVWSTWEQMQAFKTIERAYVRAQVPTADFDKAVILMKMNNSGKVPARNLSIRVAARRNTPTKIIDDFEDTYGNPEHDDLSPGSDYTVVIPLRNFSRQEHAEIMAGRETLSVKVVVVYDDGFGRVDKSVFCNVFVPSFNGWTGCKWAPGKSHKAGSQ
jgi:hypothetical protein